MKLSIITATYNSRKFINDCLRSVHSQNYNNIEHIVVDGNSSDGTLSLLNSKQDQINKLISEPDKGVYEAMNKGIEIATGDVIGFLNSDDFYIDNEILFKVAKVFMKNPLIEACYADLVYIDQINKSKIIRYWKSNKFIAGSFSKGWRPPHPTFFVRSSVYKKFGKFDLDYKISSDYELMMRFLEIYKINVCYIPEIWVKMRIGGLSNKSLKTIIEQNIEDLNALEKHKLPKNIFIFFINKVFSRLQQFFTRPNK